MSSRMKKETVETKCAHGNECFQGMPSCFSPKSNKEHLCFPVSMLGIMELSAGADTI